MPHDTWLWTSGGPSEGSEGSAGMEGSEGSANLEGSTVRIDERGNAIHTMQGIPFELALMAMAVIIVVSHVLVDRRRTRDVVPGQRWNLLSWGPAKSLVKWRGFPLFIQSISIALFLLVLATGLWGNQRLGMNIAPVLTWTWWWVLLIFIILGFGKGFCAVCPWEGLTSMVSSLSLRSRIKALGFEKPWPQWARNVYPALILFVLLTWAELGWDITRSAWLTAVMGLVMVGMAILSAIVFEKRAFCRYACLVGRVSGLYALFSPVELRPVAKDVCSSCENRECVNGSDTSTGCPTFLFPGNLRENTYCTLCTECVRACPHDNLAINVRPLGEDLMHRDRFRKDEAILAIVLLALTSFHGLTMTPQWWRINDLLRVDLGWGRTFTFTLLMALMILIPMAIFWIAAEFSNRLLKGQVSKAKLFRAFAYPLIPVALFYHLAHNGMHFFMEAQKIVPVLSDPFGWGWNLFGTAGRSYGTLLSLQSIWWIQVVLIVVGHIYGVVVSDRVARRLIDDRVLALKALIPLILVMILYSGFSIWLITQPMEMRSGM